MTATPREQLPRSAAANPTRGANEAPRRINRASTAAQRAIVLRSVVGFGRPQLWGSGINNNNNTTKRYNKEKNKALYRACFSVDSPTVRPSSAVGNSVITAGVGGLALHSVHSCL